MLARSGFNLRDVLILPARRTKICLYYEINFIASENFVYYFALNIVFLFVVAIFVASRFVPRHWHR